MTIYETIKVAISVKQAAEHYGLDVRPAACVQQRRFASSL